MANIHVFECVKCGKKYVQLKTICPNCRNIDFHLIELPGEGRVFSYTKIHVSSQDFSHLTPYTVALIEMEQGLRVTGRVNTSVEIGDRVQCTSSTNNCFLFEKVKS